MSALRSAFEAADLSDLPTPRSLTNERLLVLWALAVAEKAGRPIITPAEISTVLRDIYKIDLSRQRIQSLLAKESRTVARRKKAGLQAYQIMQTGLDELLGIASQTVVFVEPSEALSNIRKTEELLAGLRGTLSVCDPYVDGRTLDFLASCQAATAIRLLTVNITGPTAFARDVAAFNKQHGGKLRVRVAAQKDLHDRYIIHDDGLLHLGTSLNGFGKKQTFIVALGSDLRADVSVAFELRWEIAAATEIM
jgi:hypothetical protein